MHLDIVACNAQTNCAKKERELKLGELYYKHTVTTLIIDLLTIVMLKSGKEDMEHYEWSI